MIWLQQYRKKGFEFGYKMAMKKIQEYPCCDKLIYTVAMLLEGSLSMFDDGENAKYYEQIERMYERIANSKDTDIRNHVLSKLISKRIERQEYDKVQELIDVLPEHSLDKRQLQVNLYIRQKKYYQALEILEKKLIEEVKEIQTILLKLMEVHLKENKIEEAEYIADISHKTAKLYDLWDYDSYVAYFELAVFKQDATQCVQLLKSMLTAMSNKWDINSSPLYRHIKTKEDDSSLEELFLSALIKEVKEDKELAFLRDNPEFLKLLNGLYKS